MPIQPVPSLSVHMRPVPGLYAFLRCGGSALVRAAHGSIAAPSRETLASRTGTEEERDMLRVGLIGSGGIVRGRHAPAWRKLAGKAVVTAVSDVVESAAMT